MAQSGFILPKVNLDFVVLVVCFWVWALAMFV